MSAGFVYIMMNPAMRGLVKIGLTERSSGQRAAELFGTGVPDEFIVVYDELVTDCKVVEQRIHKRFHEQRYNNRREFFQIPVREAIRALMEESAEYLVPRVGADSGAEMLPDLKEKYPGFLKPDFHSIRIVHRDNVVYLESARYRYPGSKDEIIERMDLAFVHSGNERKFLADTSPTDNARLFVHQMDEYSMIHCTDLFNPDVCREIAARYEK